jgi:hypothetical protein
MKECRNHNAGSLNKLIQAGLMSLALAPLSLSAGAQQAARPAAGPPRNPPAAVPFVEATPAKSQTPGSEGITIHGHWIMNVVNRDGTIAEHRDFENALVPQQGGAILAGLLMGSFSPQTFDVVLTGTGKTALLYLNGQSCPQVLASFHGDCSPTLTQSLTAGQSSVVLNSTYTPAAAVTITTVSTNLGTCPTLSGIPTVVSAATCQATTSGTIPGSGGVGVGIYNFTAATIPDLAIAAGQSLNITVILSFS